MVRVAPSLLSADFAALGQEIATLRGADLLHFDVMDGLFVPNISFGVPVLQAVRRITELPLDVHLMIESPHRLAPAFLKAGADLLTFHYEAETPEEIGPLLKTIHAAGKKCGIALKPATPWEVLEPFLAELDLVLVMTVEPGFGGQGFMAGMLPKIEALRGRLDAMGSRALLEVDGGINPETAALCRNAGADTLAAGSDIFRRPDRAKRIEEIRG